jgi:hypothetical protein
MALNYPDHSGPKSNHIALPHMARPNAGGAISDLNLARGVYWYCIYTGAD